MIPLCGTSIYSMSRKLLVSYLRSTSKKKLFSLSLSLSFSLDREERESCLQTYERSPFIEKRLFSSTANQRILRKESNIFRSLRYQASPLSPSPEISRRRREREEGKKKERTRGVVSFVDVTLQTSLQ